MKKTLTAFVLILIFTSSCSYNGIDAINEINANANIPFPITLPEEDLEYGDEFERVEGFGGYTLNKAGLMFWVSGWPDVIDDFHITEYRFTGDEYHVFDISVGDTLDDAVTALKKQGYSRNLREESLFGDSYIFTKSNQIKVTLRIDEDEIIHEIWITAMTTNKDNVVF